ncbi:hypothetical protein [Flexistipes sinusarabici]|uniref:hypothetical protein n=1 Tax=Flexistipes sinusarabici TaxID=2352 RepID=UPI00235632C6|nr:hypothetical protein [Flexistipes sinusarabici]
MKKTLIIILSVFLSTACNIGFSTYFSSSDSDPELQWYIYFGSDFDIENTEINFRGYMDYLTRIQKIDKEDFDHTVYIDKRTTDINIVDITFNPGSCQTFDNSYIIQVKKEICENGFCDKYSYSETVSGDSLFPYGWPCEIDYEDMSGLVSSKENDLRNSGYYNVNCETGDFVTENGNYLISIVCSMEDNNYYNRIKYFYSDNLEYFDYFKPFP